MAIHLKNNKSSQTFITEAKIKEWLPGDNMFNDAIFPGKLTQGEYDLQIAIVEENSLDPKINLAIKGKLADGWYSMGKISITANNSNAVK